MTTIMLILSLACATHTGSDTAPVVAPIAPTSTDCPAGLVVDVQTLGPIWSVVVVEPSGARIAPWAQVLADSVGVNCGANGGTLTVEWGNE